MLSSLSILSTLILVSSARLDSRRSNSSGSDNVGSSGDPCAALINSDKCEFVSMDRT